MFSYEKKVKFLEKIYLDDFLVTKSNIIAKSLSIVIVLTVSIHGPLLDTNSEKSLEFSTEATTTMPLATAWKDPMEITSSK